MRIPLYDFGHDADFPSPEGDTLDDVTPLPHGVPILDIPRLERLETLLAQGSAPSVAFEQWASELLGTYELVRSEMGRLTDDNTNIRCGRCDRDLPAHQYHTGRRGDGKGGATCRDCSSTSTSLVPTARASVHVLRGCGWAYEEIALYLRDAYGIERTRRQVMDVISSRKYAKSRQRTTSLGVGSNDTASDGKVAA